MPHVRFVGRIYSAIQNKPTILAFLLRRETDAAQGSIVFLGHGLHEEGLAFWAFAAMEMMLNSHAHEEQNDWNKDGPPVL